MERIRIRVAKRASSEFCSEAHKLHPTPAPACKTIWGLVSFFQELSHYPETRSKNAK
jgi:hypothetical protein